MENETETSTIELYNSLTIKNSAPEHNPFVQAAYKEWLGDAAYGQVSKKLVHVGFKRREETTSTRAVANW